MAKKKTYRRYVTKAKRYARSRASKASLMGAIKPIGAGIAVGVIQSMVPNDALAGYGDSLVPLGVGFFMNDKTLLTLGGYQLGLKLASGITGGMTSGGPAFSAQG
jgi:hypothetical protein